MPNLYEKKDSTLLCVLDMKKYTTLIILAGLILIAGVAVQVVKQNKTKDIMKGYLLIAEEQELKLLPELGLNPDEWKVVITGVGAINIMNATRSIPKDALVVNVGYAGSSNFEIGTWVDVTEARLHHPKVTYPEPTLTLNVRAQELGLKPEVLAEMKQAVCYSGVDFVTESCFRDCAFDMEVTFIAAQGFTRLCSLKYVSDNLDIHTYREVGAGVAARD